MRILVLIHEYPPVGGGGGQVALDICRGMVERGHEVQVLTAGWGDLAHLENQAGVLVHRLSSGRTLPYKAGLTAMAGFVLASLWSGFGLIRRWKPDLIHVHFAVPGGAAAWMLSGLTGVPYVLTAHLGDVPGGVPEKTGKWFRWIYPFTPPIWKGACQVVAVSEFTRQLARQYYAVPIQVIPNGVDTQKLKPANIQAGEPPRLVFAGRFAPQKNLIQLVKILAGLKDLPWSCVLAGDGPLRGDVEREIDQLDLQARFTLTGWISPAEVQEWFRKSDILFMPSLSEGLPVVGVQALSLGLAIVAGRVGGFIDLVEQGVNGFLFDTNHPEQGMACLQTLLSDRQSLQAARQASRQMASKFDLKAIIDQYETVFEKAITD
ncbi:MAG TPA: glycosyltransferase family 4 protein [Anaerolineaceae bacterium]|nr:glycosyltransferase family 4 protein [Anaerolineaceae bacterium]